MADGWMLERVALNRMELGWVPWTQRAKVNVFSLCMSL